eukprot:COSAG05_NODE_10410_length_567_cov_0.653846_1_plen_168_part_01
MWLPSHSSLSGVHATHCSRCVFLPSSRLGSASAAADVVAREAALSGRRDLLYSNYLCQGTCARLRRSRRWPQDQLFESDQGGHCEGRLLRLLYAGKMVYPRANERACAGNDSVVLQPAVTICITLTEIYLAENDSYLPYNPFGSKAVMQRCVNRLPIGEKPVMGVAQK